VVTEAADEAGGQGFVTEFAGASKQLANLVWTPSDEQTWQSVKSGTYFSFDEIHVSNVHQAARVTDCDPSLYAYQAPWHIEFPQGTVVRGGADSVGQWPDAVAAEPANFRIRTLATTGEGRVLADNSDAIHADLAAYNAGIPTPSGSTDAPSSDTGGSGGLCTLRAPGSGSGRDLVSTSVALAALASFGWARRRRAGP
jgi:hypothetical protein